MANPILVTGAAGRVGAVGRTITQMLLRQGKAVRAMVRSIKKVDGVAALEGVELVTGDFNDKESVPSALKDVERAFLLTTSSEQFEVGTIKDPDLVFTRYAP